MAGETILEGDVALTGPTVTIGHPAGPGPAGAGSKLWVRAVVAGRYPLVFRCPQRRRRRRRRRRRPNCPPPPPSPPMASGRSPLSPSRLGSSM